ncbi:MAG: hypothetical protein HRT45_10080 [Bdellovibrionales bacterium]|nr:hypothetical protein [Bdellovibrionales bacterium]
MLPLAVKKNQPYDVVKNYDKTSRFRVYEAAFEKARCTSQNKATDRLQAAKFQAKKFKMNLSENTFRHLWASQDSKINCPSTGDCVMGSKDGKYQVTLSESGDEYKVTLKTKDESRARAFKIPRWPVVDWETQIGVVDLYQKGSLHLLVVTQYQRGAFGHKVPHPFLYLY